jgi:hypothetical protein
VYFAGKVGATGDGGATGGAGATIGGGAGSRGAIAHPAMIKVAAAARAMRAACEGRGSFKMKWFFLEALVALLIAVAIVAWTMGPKRGKPPRAPKDAGNRPL